MVLNEIQYHKFVHNKQKKNCIHTFQDHIHIYFHFQYKDSCFKQVSCIYDLVIMLQLLLYFSIFFYI